MSRTAECPKLRGDERIDMSDNPYINPVDDQQDLAVRIQQRRETTEAALAMFDGNRLALIAALSRRSRAARRALLGEQTTSPGAESVRRDPATDGRAATAGQPLLAVD
jgi:hypothetical protein